MEDPALEVEALRARLADAERQVLRQEQLTRELLRASLEGFHIVGARGEIRDCNEAFAEIVGYTRVDDPARRRRAGRPAGRRIDRVRAAALLEHLLAGVAERRATTAILDITGVPVVDADVAAALVHAAHAVRLLGARALLTGVRPEVATTLVDLGLDLRGLVTLGTLQSGLAWARERR
jgi:anti-anti-sigma regulatory factor